MPTLTPEGLTAAPSSSSDAARAGLTSEGGRSYAQAQRQRQARDADDPPDTAPRTPAADAPTSVKLQDVIERHHIALDANDLAVVNAAVVELQAYEALRATPPEALPTEAPVNRDVPYASQAGDTLSCTMGNWENEPSSYAYQWQLDGVDVGSANVEPTYVVLPSDVGMTATCVVTATNAIGSTTAPKSNPVVIADPSSSQDAVRTGQHEPPAREA